MGRPPVLDPRQKTSFSIKKSLLEKLTKIAEERGISKSNFVEELIENHQANPGEVIKKGSHLI